MKYAKCLSSGTPSLMGVGGWWWERQSSVPALQELRGQWDHTQSDMEADTQAPSIIEQTQHQSWCLLCVPAVCQACATHKVITQWSSLQAVLPSKMATNK